MANNLVTEAYLAANFSPKSGITPGGDDHYILNCNEILARYNVTISPSTGNFCPKQSELTSLETIVLLGSTGSYNFNSNPINNTLTIPANTKLLVVTIHALYSDRIFAAPTWNGVEMQTPYGNSYTSEVLYLINPAAGTYSLSVPNAGGATLNINYHWYGISSGNISLYSYIRTGANSNTRTATVNFQQNKKVLVVDAVTYRNYNSNPVVYVSNSDVKRSFTVVDYYQASSVQDAAFYSGSNTQKTLTWNIQNQSTMGSTLLVFQV